MGAARMTSLAPRMDSFRLTAQIRRPGHDCAVTIFRDNETLSPELVLVDPELAARARERLEEPRIPKVSAPVRPSAPAATPRSATPEIGRAGPQAPAATRPRPVRRRLLFRFAVTVGLALVAAAVLVVDSDAPGVSVPAVDRSTPLRVEEPANPAVENADARPPGPASKKAAVIATPHR